MLRSSFYSIFILGSKCRIFLRGNKPFSSSSESGFYLDCAFLGDNHVVHFYPLIVLALLDALVFGQLEFLPEAGSLSEHHLLSIGVKADSYGYLQ